MEDGPSEVFFCTRCTEDGASSLVGTVLRVAADMTEPPLVAVEATRFLGALLQVEPTVCIYVLRDAESA